MNEAEYRHVQNVRFQIEEHFAIEAGGGGGPFKLIPKEKLRAQLGLSDHASWFFSTLDNAGSWVSGFTDGLMYARIHRAKGMKA